jgi:hypothetical protein
MNKYLRVKKISLNFQYLNLLLITFLLLLSLPSAAKATSRGFLDFNLYPYLTDVYNDSVFTLNAAAKLKHRFSYFGLINLYNQAGHKAGDTNAYYTEQNLRWKIAESSPFDLTMQLNFRTGEDNDRYRLGIRWRLNDTLFLQDFFTQTHIRYAINLHALQFDHEDGNVWQLEHSLMIKFPYISNRLYLSAFADHTFNQSLPTNFPRNPIVAEAQLGYELFENFYLITEYRLNQYRRADVNNLAIGLQYKVIF